jgi:hypothetical protein
VKLQMLIVPVVAAAALTSGCASWHAQDRGNDYQCGYSGSIEGALAGRQLRPGCGAEYAGVDGDETITGKRDRLAGRIQQTCGITVDQAERQVKEFEEIHKDFQPKSQA